MVLIHLRLIRMMIPIDHTNTKILTVAILAIVAAVALTRVAGWMEVPNHSIPPHDCLGQFLFCKLDESVCLRVDQAGHGGAGTWSQIANRRRKNGAHDGRF